MINFYKTTTKDRVARILSKKICTGLDKGSVLWLVGGGSVMDIAIKAAKELKDHDNLSNLSVTLTDERFGAVGHTDSNWKQLLEAGLALDGSNLLPVLTGNNRDETVASYTKLLQHERDRSLYSVALAGIGADGHIFGIKPHSPAVDSLRIVVGYEWPDYTRITPTIRLIKQLDEVIIYAAGEEKHGQLDRIEQEMSAQDQPAQLLKQVKMVSIYNDYKGEKL